MQLLLSVVLSWLSCVIEEGVASLRASMFWLCKEVEEVMCWHRAKTAVDEAGSITGTLVLTCGSTTDEVKIDLVIEKLLDAGKIAEAKKAIQAVPLLLRGILGTVHL